MDFPFPSQMTAMRVDRQGRAEAMTATSASALPILNRMCRVGPNAEESKAEFCRVVEILQSVGMFSMAVTQQLGGREKLTKIDSKS
jgi:hypothetical protein